MGAGFRRIVRRASLAAGVLLISIALAAMIANQFRVLYLVGNADRVYFERGVVRHVWTTASRGPAQLPRALVSAMFARGTRQSPWDVHMPKRLSAHDAAFGPYEWLPRHTNDGSAASFSLPWWMLGALGGLLASAGLWSIRTPRGHCRKCEYDLRGLPAGASVCPECGAKLPAASAPSSASLCESSTSAHA